MAEVIAGRYELVREVGRGASATVYRAHDATLDRYVAIKLVAPALSNDPDFVDRFMREARLAARLQHPNIVTVHDVGETEDHRPFLAMALVEGASLDDVIRESAPLPLPEATRILRDLAGALEYLHSEGLIHRDVKPSNVLIEESGRVVLSDFGIAYAREAARYTNTGILLGTPRYMAPEQFKGEEPTERTDVYALGVVAFELLAGAPPFEGTGTGLMYRIVHESPPPVTSFAPNLTPGIEAAIARALAKDPTERWASPAAFVAALMDPAADATMAGPASAFRAAAAVAPPLVTQDVPPELPPAEPSEHPAAVDGETEAAPPSPPVAGAAAGGGGRGKYIVGTLGAGIIGLGIGGFCLAAGGFDPSAADDSPDPTATIATQTSTSGSSATVSAAEQTPSPAAPTPSPSAVTGSTVVPAGETSAPALVTATNTPRPAATATPPPAATSTNTPVPAATATNTPLPTATVTSTATRTPTPTNTPLPTATPTLTPTPTPTPAPPTAPSNVVRNGQTLSWSDNSNNESGFRIYYRYRDLNSPGTFVVHDDTVGPNTTATTAKTVFLQGTTYDFARGVSAYNAAGESAIAWE